MAVNKHDAFYLVFDIRLFAYTSSEQERSLDGYRLRVCCII